MKNFNMKDIFKPTFILFTICFTVTLLLSLTNFLTKNAIEAQNIKNDETAKKIVLPQAVSFKENTSSGIAYSTGFDKSGKLNGYIFYGEAKGYGGKMKVMTGISPEKKILGVTILSHNETPGLGANIANSNFTDQFCKGTFHDKFVVKKENATNNNEINAITGATISSKATAEAVNKALYSYEQVLTKEGANFE